MRGAKALILLFGAGAFVGAGVGLVVGSAWSESRLEALRDDVAAARADAERAAAQLRERDAQLREATSRSRVRPTAPEAATDPDDAAVAASLDDATVAPVDAVLDEAARRARVAELAAYRPVWLERGDGEAALSALRELAALVPEGRDEAMALALAINADVSGEGRLKLSDVSFYTGLADPAIKGLMDWALLRDDTPSGFRVMAAYSLPWVQDPAKTLDQFAAALRQESQQDVQRALVANLGRLRAPEAERLLGEILGDPNGDPSLRAQVASELALTDDAGIVRALEIAASDDEDEGVRAAARAALIARDPPASGYLVTGTLPESQAAAAGLRAGDVLVSYDGRSTLSVEELRAAASQAEGRETVNVVVVRDGAEVTLAMRPGRLGVFGRAVEARER